MATCYRCSGPLHELSKFCSACGTPTMATCHRCSGPLHELSKFCSYCGTQSHAQATPQRPQIYSAINHAGIDRRSQRGNKIVGAFKITKGIVLGCMAMLTSLGLGLTGGFLRSHHMMGVASRIGEKEMKSALKKIEEGVECWKSAD